MIRVMSMSGNGSMPPGKFSHCLKKWKGTALEILFYNGPNCGKNQHFTSTVEEQPKSFNDGYLRGFENLGLGLRSRKDVELGDESKFEVQGNEDVDEISERELKEKEKDWGTMVTKTN
ncbi:hypothetical protein V6N11_056340 [Hibiscus sabdariffa]|uniref:Uncharacterized protein n=1 Tax=Hibiscus sabdariffa TaxID=183260 RepID=A0ABR2T3I9_9ROSI